MRGYTGIFSFPVTIDDPKLASHCGISVPALHQILYRLSLEHVINYIPSDHASVICLHHDRLREGNVNLSPAKYAQLLSSYKERSEQILLYASRTDTCRSRILLEYFGQKESRDCLCCDVCRAARGNSSLEKRIREFISGRGGKYTLAEFREAVPDGVALLRKMIEDGSADAPEDYSPDSMTRPS